jgi:hypothetical protein
MPTIHLTRHLRNVAPTAPVEVVGATLGAALDAYFSAVPKARSYVLDDQGRLRRHVAVFVDGELLMDKSNLKLPVTARTEIYVMQALSGG